MVELPHEELLKCSDEDRILFNRWVIGLPTRRGNNGDFLDKYGIEIPYGSEAHIIQWFRKTIGIVKPKAIFEIGLNLGASAALWLNMSEASVLSIDISDKDETIYAGNYLKEKFPNRFNYKIMPSATVGKNLKGFFDLAFIDGAHDEKSVENDISLCIDLEIPYILFDDTYTRYGGVAKAISTFSDKLTLVEDMNNLKLYKNG